MLDRRHFLRQAAGASAFVVASPMLGRSLPQSKPNPVRLSVCIDMIMTDIPFLERIERVKRLGYPAFEFWEWKNKDVEAILKKKNELGLEIATMMGSGWKHMNSEDARKTFVAEIQASLATAKRLGVKTLIVTTGFEDKQMPRSEQHANYVAALKAAARFADPGRRHLGPPRPGAARQSRTASPLSSRRAQYCRQRELRGVALFARGGVCPGASWRRDRALRHPL